MNRMNLSFFRILLMLIVVSISVNATGQLMDCASTLKYRYASPPYTFNEQSKSATCYSGEKYEYNISLSHDTEYRFSFFASPIFNNNIRFKIINTTTGELLLNLPGEAAGNNTSAILQDYFDEKQNKFIHPFFDLAPETDCNYKVIVEVGELRENKAMKSSVILADSDQKKGCVTIFMQSKSAENYGF